MRSVEGIRVLLIGGAGFIGHHLALELRKRGAEVTIVDGLQVNNLLSLISKDNQIPNKEFYSRLINQRIKLLELRQIPLLVQDAREYHVLSKIIGEIQPNVVVHLAAVAHANRSNKDPYTTFDHSLRTLENALDACRDLGTHFIYFSSSMVYGNFRADQVFEDTPCEPLGIYGALKFAGEKIVIAYNQVFGLPYTIVRPSALYGERCVSRRVGQIFAENALAGKEIRVNGDGEDRLDFTYIQDLVNGIILTMENGNARNEIFNLTYGESRSLADMIEVLKSTFPEASIYFEEKDKLMPTRGTLCVDKAKSLLGYAPSFPLKRGYQQYLKWYINDSDFLYGDENSTNFAEFSDNMRDIQRDKLIGVPTSGTDGDGEKSVS